MKIDDTWPGDGAFYVVQRCQRDNGTIDDVTHGPYRTKPEAKQAEKNWKSLANAAGRCLSSRVEER